MKESALKARARTAILNRCPGAKIYNHQDRFLRGVPDTSVTWGAPTTWLEFKHLALRGNIHGELRQDQLVELVQLEKTCGRAWVIAYRGSELTDIYRPTALLGGRQPEPEQVFEGVGPGNLIDLTARGVIRLSGHNHRGIADLIYHTHV